jgi:hypothetical protein
LYEYIAVYTDDLTIASRDPRKIINALGNNLGFNLKGVGPISYHLGCDYTRDPYGTLCCGPRKYIRKKNKVLNSVLTLLRAFTLILLKDREDNATRPSGLELRELVVYIFS